MKITLEIDSHSADDMATYFVLNSSEEILAALRDLYFLRKHAEDEECDKGAIVLELDNILDQLPTKLIDEFET